MTHSSIPVVLSATFVLVVSIGAKFEAQATMSRFRPLCGHSAGYRRSLDAHTALVVLEVYLESCVSTGSIVITGHSPIRFRGEL